MSDLEKFWLFIVATGFMLVIVSFLIKGIVFMDIAIKYLEGH